MRNQYSEDLERAMTQHMTIGGEDVHQVKSEDVEENVEQKKDAESEEETTSETKPEEENEKD